MLGLGFSSASHKKHIHSVIFQNLQSFAFKKSLQITLKPLKAVSSSSGNLIYVFDHRKLMKYDREKKVWALVASLPGEGEGEGEGLSFITCASEWRDWIFVSTCGFFREDISYLFNPSTSQWINVNGDGFVGMVVSATTVEI